MSERLNIVVESENASPEELDGITRELLSWINETAPGAKADLVTSKSTLQGAKAIDVALLGVLSLHLLQSGILKEVIKSLSAYVTQRRRKVSLTVKNSNGKNVVINTENIGRQELSDLIRQANELVESSG